MNNLPEIRDIHIPDGVSFFPLASGWWFILALFLSLCLALIIAFWIIRTSKKYFAKQALEKIDVSSPVQTALEVSELLKRICILKYKDALTLYGQDWIDFLNHHAKKDLSKEATDLLKFAPFIKAENVKYTEKEALEIKTFAKEWIGANL